MHHKWLNKRKNKKNLHTENNKQYIFMCLFICGAPSFLISNLNSLTPRIDVVTESQKYGRVVKKEAIKIN